MASKQIKPNFLEIADVGDANRVNLDEYSFHRFSETKGKYLFHKRMRKK